MRFAGAAASFAVRFSRWLRRQRSQLPLRAKKAYAIPVCAIRPIAERILAPSTHAIFHSSTHAPKAPKRRRLPSAPSVRRMTWLLDARAASRSKLKAST